tara:strand:+ start:585 stop:2816 length:2232 start_codon:yes stop_codon:yes gene_type:complete
MNKLPSKEDILKWVQEHPDKASKRDISKAFSITGDARTELKRMLRELRADGLISGSRRAFRGAGELPPVSVLRVSELDGAGDLWAEPAEWDSENDRPRILFIAKKDDPALTVGDRILCRISPVEGQDHDLEARLIRRIGSGPDLVIGIYRLGSEGGRLVPVDKKSTREYKISSRDANGAKDGELVEAEQIGPKARMGLPSARVMEVLGDPMAPRSISLIAIHQHEIPDHFPDDVIIEAEAAQLVALGDRTDLRHLPLFTIDPFDARDRDDAICAAPDEDPANVGGHIVWVAIADVAHYVRPGSKLDKEARKRGNSTYFPDRVVPMLPDALSGDLCSLHEGVDRACMAVRIKLNAKGAKLDHEFHRGLMRSPAALSYEQAQAAFEGTYDDATKPLTGPLADLFAAYQSATIARNERQPLNLDLPERKIILSDEGKVLSVDFRARFDAHKLVEEFMVTANVCAAETLEAKKKNLLYRVHEEPTPEKLEVLRETAEAAGLDFAKGQVLKTIHLNKLLAAAEDTEDAEIINMSVLRSMTQAYYGPSNFGHFGLNLRRYAHFTSPIRRYADLIVHRALVSAHNFGDDGLSQEEEAVLQETGEWISTTERRSMLAERDTTDRYLAAFLADRVGAEFTGRVSGIAKFGLFVKLDDTGADGIIPLSQLGREYWRFNERERTLQGEESNRIIAVGMPCKVSLVDATALTGGLTLEMLELNGEAMPKGSGRQKSHKGRRVARSKDKGKRKKNR